MCISHTLRTRGIENEMSKGCLTTDSQDYSLQSGSPWRGRGGGGGGGGGVVGGVNGFGEA